jgi:hypothetical protein
MHVIIYLFDRRLDLHYSTYNIKVMVVKFIGKRDAEISHKRISR